MRSYCHMSIVGPLYKKIYTIIIVFSLSLLCLLDAQTSYLCFSMHPSIFPYMLRTTAMANTQILTLTNTYMDTHTICPYISLYIKKRRD